jgi:hypothetical protein
MIEHNIKVFLRSRGISGSLRDSAGTARYVLVQEITHVLQGIKRHSDEGIVKAHWDVYTTTACSPRTWTLHKRT